MKRKNYPSRRWKNSDLLEFFDTSNSRYFEGELERPVLLMFRTMDSLGHTKRMRQQNRRSEQDTFAIYISRSIAFSRRLWATTLLHEMVHYKQRNKFTCGIRGKIFNREMKRLAELGAFNGLW